MFSYSWRPECHQATGVLERGDFVGGRAMRRGARIVFWECFPRPRSKGFNEFSSSVPAWSNSAW
jgi:hypothetical protein